MMDARRVVVLSCDMASSTAGLARSLHLIIPEDGSVEDGGDGVSTCTSACVVCLLLDWFVPPASHWVAWLRPSDLHDVH